MGTWLNHPWVAWTIAGLMLAYGGFLGAWALFRDRSRGRRRCPKCWYDLRGTPEMRCSECGYEAKREWQLFRTRRRWRLALLGLLVVLGGIGAGLSPQVRRDGWLSLVPTDVLLRLSPPVGRTWDAPQPDAVSRAVVTELHRRCGLRSDLSSSQWEYLIEHKGVLRARRRWPEATRLAVLLAVPSYDPDVTVIACPRMPGATRSRLCGMSLVFSSDPPPPKSPERFPQYVGVMPSGLHSVVFDCTVRSGFGDPERSGLLWEGAVRFPVEAVASVDDAITPVRDAAVTEAVRRALHVEEVPRFKRAWTGEDRHAWPLRFSIRRTQAPILGDIAVGFVAELLRDGDVASAAVVLPAHLWTEQALYEGRWAYFRLGDDDQEKVSEMMDPWTYAPGARWQLRIRGDGEAALTDWDRDKYWAGEFTIPLEETLR